MNRTAVVLAVVAAACAGSPEPEPVAKPFDQKVLVATASGSGYSLELRADAPPQVGLNALYLRVTASGAPVTDAVVGFRPVLGTLLGPRACPVVGPGAASTDGIHEAAAVFDEPSGTDLIWTASATVTRGGSTSPPIEFPSFQVVPGKNLARSFDDGATTYVMALEFRQALKVGENPIVVTLHATADGGATYAPVDDATLEIDPQMPEMGHGSKVTFPARTAAGRYEGQAAFTMTGYWVVHATARRGGLPIGAPEFAVSF